MKSKKRFITSVWDYNDECDEILSQFLKTFTFGDGLVRFPNEDDFDTFGHENIEFVYTQKGMKLYDSYCKKLYQLGMKYFPEEDLNIESSIIIWP